MLPPMPEGAPVAVVIPSWNIARAAAAVPRLAAGAGDAAGAAGRRQRLRRRLASSYLERRGCRTSRCRRTSASPRAINLGAAQPRRRAVLALNADTVLEPGAVRALAEALDADPSLGGVQPRILQTRASRERDPRRRPASTAPARR